MKCAVALYLVLLTTASFAQNAPSVPGTAGLQRALGTKLMAEINSGLECSASLNNAMDENTQLKAEIMRLKDKYEPKEEKKN